MRLRAYKTEDCEAMASLFYDTVHRVNARDYAPEQLDAWATGEVDLDAWNARYLSSTTLVAEENGALLGFANMDKTGYLDMLYVHADAQNSGIATALCDALERLVHAETYTTHASLTARPFFEKRGYAVVRQQQVPLRGQILTNFVMEKRLEPLQITLWQRLDASAQQRIFGQLQRSSMGPVRGGWKALRREMDAVQEGKLPQFLFGVRQNELVGWMLLVAERENHSKTLPWWALHNADELCVADARAMLERGAAVCRACGAPVLAARLEGESRP